ncbi:DUF6571 family protein [Streptomyces carminius]|uniref:DUF6571 family protein n=1 Tax=Streptomyces carminius TaxID=2665496 RepID=UPI0013045C81|nr:DUF6571 family protein [Streptomyces carminius]
MAVDYETILSTDLSGLAKAASAWKKMGKRFGELHDDYRDHVKAAVEADSWRGESVLAYKSQAQTTLEEYAGARDEARAVGALLEEAHRTLTDRRDAVIGKRDEAVEAYMDVDPHSGRCTLNLGRMDEERAEFYRRDQLARGELEESWTNAIRNAVRDVQDADENFRRALMANPDDGGRGLADGFNPALKGDAGEANAVRAGELYEKIRNGGKLSGAEREELASLMRANEADTEFSRTFVTSVGGPDGVIRMHNELTDRAYYDEPGQKKHYQGLDRHLANVVATATTVDDKDEAGDRKFYGQWREELRKAGVEKYDAEVVGGEYGGQQVRGYQAMVTLMQNGDGYDPEFLHDLADDIRAAEDPAKGGDPDIWDLNRGYAGERGGWFANDPYDGVLGIMSKSPDAATAYFDPASKLGGDRLDYLQKERDWNIVDNAEIHGNVEVSRPDTEDTDSRTGFGAALEAAMTGQVPGEEPVTTDENGNKKDPTHHTEAQVRVLEQVVTSYADIAAVDKSAIPENIRQNMANALAYYPNDVHDIIGKDGNFSSKELSTQPNDVDVHRETMLRFIRGVAEDGGAFRTIHDSQMEIIAHDVSSLREEDFRRGTAKAEGVAQMSGQTMGALDHVRADVLGSHRDDVISQNNWNKVYSYHTLGAPVTGIPVVGDVLQRLVDIGTGQLAEGLNNEVSDKATEELIQQYRRDGYPRLESMIQRQAAQSGMSDEELGDGRLGFQRVILAMAKHEYSAAIHDSQGSTGTNS